MFVYLSSIDFSGRGGTAVLTSDTFTSNNTYTPPTGIDGYSSVTVSVDVVGPYNSGVTVGYNSGTTDGMAAQKALLSSTAFTDNGTYTSENGFSSVTVNVSSGVENRLNARLRGALTSVTQDDISGMASNVPLPANAFAGNPIVSCPPLHFYRLMGSAFSGCRSLSSVTLSNPDGRVYFDGSVFADCNNLITISGITGLCLRNASDSLFKSCNKLVSIPPFIDLTGGTSNGFSTNAFDNCHALTGLTFVGAASFTIASYNTFKGTSSLTCFDFTEATTIPTIQNNNAFTACSANYEIRVPQALYNDWTGKTSAMTNVVGHIVACASTLSNCQFTYTASSQPTFANIDKQYTKISGSYDSTSHTGVSEYFGFQVVKENCFQAISQLTALNFGEGVTTINRNCIWNCANLSAITLPTTITKLDNYWVGQYSRNKVSSITIKATTPPEVDANSFSGNDLNQNGTLYVPADSVSAYQTWKTNMGTTRITNWTISAIQ